ncbi:MAG TPA: tetratricopeptide repeat protein [Candidatus Binataceae bacterium]|nr:tetratricopeptide repeat protein [Candidatus Binataceae bacterium]
MNSSLGNSRVWMALAAVGALVLVSSVARAQSVSQLSQEVSGVTAKVPSALSNESAAGPVLSDLDRLEAMYAKVASEPSTNQMALEPIYHELESALNQMYETYKKKKDDCIAQIDNGGQCDYSVAEQLSLQALYPLSWLRFQGATSVYANNEAQAKKLLNEAIDGFTESTLVIVDPNLVRENLLGRANCEKELGKFDHSEYDKAIADFNKILEDGRETPQAKPAIQGLASTYGLMGDADKAAKYAGMLGEGGPQKGGTLMLQLQSIFSAENATTDPAKKAAYHKQIVDKIKAVEDDKQNWAVAIAAVGKYVRNPVEEFGNSSDPFEKWLLANVLLSKHDENGAAKYYIEAARGSGKYNKGFKYAADIYYKQKRFDMVEQLANEMAKSGGSDAQWAAYMAYALPRQQWESSGMKNAQLNDQWTKAAQNYLSKYSSGQYAPEMRFRLGEDLQRQGKYLEAAKMYSQVTGENEYAFTAKFNSAECNYLALVSAGNSKDKNAAAINVDQLRTETMKDLQETIKMEPEAERTASNPQQKKFVHDVKGRAIYMLAGLMQEKNPDPKEIASMLENYESQYPNMSDKFKDVQEWRIVALSQLGRYDDVDKDLASIVAKNKGNTAQSDFIKELGLDFWKAAQDAQDKGDDKAFKANAKLTVTAYSFFEDLVQSGKTQAKNLTGTLSILGKAYLALGEESKAQAVFNQVVKADAASPDANAGLAMIAQAKGDNKDAITLWTNVENTAAESDNLWYEAKYNIAVIYAAQGNIQGACSKLAQTRAEHPTLGTPEIAKRWNTLQHKICLDHK